VEIHKKADKVINIKEMKAINLLLIISSFIALPFSHLVASDDLPQDVTGWRAGVARVTITPEKSMWLAGYGARNRPSEGTLHDLWAKALAVEDANGKQAVLVTTDLLGIPKNMSDRIRERLKEKFNLSKSQVILNSSHTHTAPVLQSSLPDVYPLNAGQKEDVLQYTKFVEDKIVNIIGEALSSMEPVQLYAENGVTRFQVNRRNNNESTLDQQAELKGPNDYAVPVIKVVNKAGDLMAVAFGYACHPTVLSGYQWSGDYAGFAQIELEKKYPNTTALFFQGAGGDQNPLPRRSVPLAQQYGETLAAAVERVLSEEMRPLPSRLSTAYSEVNLPLNNPSEQELEKIIASSSSGTHKRWATRLLNQMEKGEPLMDSYPYPLQVWQLGDQLIFTLGGELVIEYAIKLKEMYGQDIFVLGYSNDVMSYIPSTRILLEGGYEGETSQRTYGMPGLWAPTIETKILNGFMQLTSQERFLLSSQ
jgi:neutral ceramidase